jgi:hypothetical protein
MTPKYGSLGRSVDCRCMKKQTQLTTNRFSGGAHPQNILQPLQSFHTPPRGICPLRENVDKGLLIKLQ